MPPSKFGHSHSAIGWEDSIILLGGWSNKRGVQIFNITSQTWKVQNSSNVPMDIAWSSSLLADQHLVLFAGSASQPFFYSAAKYNPRSDTWIKLKNSHKNHLATCLVKLGSRVFAFGGQDAHSAEEFNLASNTWTNIDTKLINKCSGCHSILALPT
jgi:hypothetical protein